MMPSGFLNSFIGFEHAIVVFPESDRVLLLYSLVVLDLAPDEVLPHQHLRQVRHYQPINTKYY